MDSDGVSREDTKMTSPNPYPCVKCEYNLTGTPMGNPCPECGTDFRIESAIDRRTCKYATTSIVLGALSIAMSFLYGLGLILGILAIVYARKTERQVKNDLAPPALLGIAKAGRITGWIGIALTIIFLATMGYIVADLVINGVY